jgi:hypothetical protein
MGAKNKAAQKAQAPKPAEPVAAAEPTPEPVVEEVAAEAPVEAPVPPVETAAIAAIAKAEPASAPVVAATGRSRKARPASRAHAGRGGGALPELSACGQGGPTGPGATSGQANRCGCVGGSACGLVVGVRTAHELPRLPRFDLGLLGKIYQTRHPVGLHSVACDSQQCT